MSETSHPPAGPAGPPPLAPRAQSAPGQPFGDRVIKLWQALAVAAACLIVGLGIGGVLGGALGFVAGHHDSEHDRDGRFHMDRRDGFDGRFKGPGAIDRWPQQAPPSDTPAAPPTPQG